MSFFDKTKLSDSSGTLINPVQDETVILLRRIAKLLEPVSVIDSNNRQRVVVDSTAAVTQSGTWNLGNVPVDQRYQITDAARLTYDNGIRCHLSFS